MIVGRLKNHCPKGVLVDIGCGPGHRLASFTEALPHLRVIGVDIAEDMIQRATNKLSSLGFNEHVEFRQGDAAKLPFQDGTVDFVVTTLSLHHCKMHKKSWTKYIESWELEDNSCSLILGGICTMSSTGSFAWLKDLLCQSP